jgi:hypothetical protein
VREKLNDNPIAQVALIGVLVVFAAVMFLKPMGGGEEEEAGTTEATVSVVGTGASGTATGATPGEAVEGAVEGAIEPAAAETSAAAAGAAIPAPPVPPPVARAYDAGKTVVLLVVHDGGIDDRLVRGTIGRVETFPDVALFVVPAKQIARYAAITLGTEVQQVPALVTMRPRGLGGDVPQASVDYGFQTAQSVVQAVVDARYKGPEETYHPD